jgi:hypothetical protein
MVLLREHGCDLEIAPHLIGYLRRLHLFNKKWMQGWCLAGFPAVQILNGNS